MNNNTTPFRRCSDTLAGVLPTGWVAKPSSLWGGMKGLCTKDGTVNNKQFNWVIIIVARDVLVQFWTMVRTWTFQNLTEVRFKIRAERRTEPIVRSKVARLFPAFSSSESVRLSKGSSPKPSSTGFSGLLSLHGVDSVWWDLGSLAKSSSGWCSGNGTKRGERCRLEATDVLVPLWVQIGIELRALEFLDVLGGVSD